MVGAGDAVSHADILTYHTDALANIDQRRSEVVRERDDAIRAAYRDGVSAASIAEYAEISRQLVHRIVKAGG